MTRVNVGIDPRELNNQLLFTEYREITRIPNAISSGRANYNQPIPEQFTLGDGHVIFFYNKLRYLFRRYLVIRELCWKRRINITDTASAFTEPAFPHKLWGEYQPTLDDRLIILKRFEEKGHVLLPLEKRDVSL
jgi:deoxyribonuclease (pyrimidine dimer)